MTADYGAGWRVAGGVDYDLIGYVDGHVPKWLKRKQAQQRHPARQRDLPPNDGLQA